MEISTVAFPAGYGATVHLYWPGKGFQLLGMYVINTVLPHCMSNPYYVQALE